MTATLSEPTTLPPDATAPAGSLEERLATLEAFASQVTGAIDNLVGAVLEVQQGVHQGVQHARPAGDETLPAKTAAELDALKAKVKELDQQLTLERACRDLAQVSRMHAKARRVVFVGTTYFGCNVKYAYLAALQQAAQRKLDAWFLPQNNEQFQLVTQLGGQCLPVGYTNWGPEHLHVALSAAVVVTSDHLLNPNPYAAALLAGARQVQLWHGVSIKEIGLRNLPGGRALGPHLARVLSTCGPYATLLGTAAAGEDEWRRWFAFDRYAAAGYPRNDVLYRTPTEADLAGCDRAAFDRAVATRAKGRRVILYAPTFRDGRPDWVLQAGLDRLAQAASQGGDLLVVALHPVEAAMVPKLAPLMPAVAFVTPRTDLYPLLGQASALVTDYSSIMFDYLHLNRPVLWYRPDHAAYTQQSRKLFDDKLRALPGPVFDDAAALAKALRRDDLAQTPAHAALRQALLAQWFDQHDGQAASRVLDLVCDELTRAGAEEAA